MAEIRKIMCDMCGRIIGSGHTVASSRRRSIIGGARDHGAFRFDICDECFARLQEACRARKEAQA